MFTMNTPNRKSVKTTYNNKKEIKDLRNERTLTYVYFKKR